MPEASDRAASPTARAVRYDVDPSLLDVVPWSHGFGHSWALAALLSDPRLQPAILAALPSLPGPCPHRVCGEIHREKGLKPRRADLAFTLVDADGGRHDIAVETKVNDPFDVDQVLAYRNAGCVPVLYLPAGTGVLLAAAPITDAREIRLTPDALLTAVDSTGLTFAPLLAGYVADLRTETDRAARALARARGERVEPIGQGRTPRRTLADVAWIAEAARALSAAADGSPVGADVTIRIEANDRGFFYASSFAWLPGGGALWVDLLAEVRTGKRSVAVKAGEHDVSGAWDMAAKQGPPAGDGWRRAARRVSGGTCTVWKLDVDGDVTACDVAEACVRAATFTRSLKRAEPGGAWGTT